MDIEKGHCRWAAAPLYLRREIPAYSLETFGGFFSFCAMLDEIGGLK